MSKKTYQEEAVKPRKKKKRKKKRYLLKFFLLVVFCIGSYYFLSSEFFDIQDVAVENSKYYTKEQIVAMTEIKIGSNLFGTSMGDAKKKLMKDPYIKNAKVKRRIPGTVKVSIEERTENAIIPYEAKFIVIDSEGLVLRIADTAPALTILSGMTVKKMKPGEPLEVEQNANFAETLKMLAEMEKNEVYFKKIEIASVVIKAYIYDQLVCVGTPEMFISSMGILQQTVYHLNEQGIERGTIKISGENEVAWSPLIE